MPAFERATISTIEILSVFKTFFWISADQLAASFPWIMSFPAKFSPEKVFSRLKISVPATTAFAVNFSPWTYESFPPPMPNTETDKSNVFTTLSSVFPESFATSIFSCPSRLMATFPLKSVFFPWDTAVNSATKRSTSPESDEILSVYVSPFRAFSMTLLSFDPWSVAVNFVSLYNASFVSKVIFPVIESSASFDSNSCFCSSFGSKFAKSFESRANKSTKRALSRVTSNVRLEPSVTAAPVDEKIWYSVKYFSKSAVWSFASFWRSS